MARYEEITVYLPQELDQAMEAAANAKGVSVSRFASDCMEEYLERLTTLAR